jgi:hypothetical protein
MNLRKWSRSEAEYGRKVLDSTVEGIRSGEERFLLGKPLAPFVAKSVQASLVPAAVGACLGALATLPANREGRASRMLFFGLLGGALGLSAGLVWESRRITANAAHGARENVHKIRDEHWVEKHPVAYA